MLIRRLVNSRLLLPIVVLSCYVSVGMLQIIKRLRVKLMMLMMKKSNAAEPEVEVIHSLIVSFILLRI